LNLRFLPNAICVLRMLLVIPVVVALVRAQYGSTIALFAFAAFTDGLDGFLAKRFGWMSELGKVLDPLADKLLLVTVFITLTVVGLVPLWLAVVVVARDVIIGAGAGIFTVVFGPLNGNPTNVSKLNTLCQILYVLAVIEAAASARLPLVVVTVLGALVLVTTSVSGIDYVLTYIRRASEVARARRTASV
jgi:cardiolipin synthase (CMP-forming)